MRIGKKTTLVIAAAALAAATLFRPGAFDLAAQDHRVAAMLSEATTPAEAGAIQFAFGDWGGLTTAGLEVATLPERLANAALVANTGTDPTPDALARIYRDFGLLTPTSIGNWPETLEAPGPVVPLGRAVGQASSVWPPAEITLGNGTCALCHAGVTYGPDGRPNPDRAWLGMPNTSLDLGTYVTALADGFEGASDAQLMQTARALYPDMSLTERLTLRYAVLPRLRSALAERQQANDGAALSFQPGRIGATNGVDSFAEQLGILRHPAPNTVTSLPDLSQRHLRTRFLTLGLYENLQADGETTPAQMAELIALFTIPAFGIPPDTISALYPAGEDVASFLATYRPQPFPGRTDMARAAEGWRIYGNRCAACHGRYSFDSQRPRLHTFPNWRGEVGTDPELAEAVSPELAKAVDALLTGSFEAQPPQGYAAPPLGGLWASAPYLHSGTVPSIWHLLTPEARPQTFAVGGHALDFETMGIAYPDGYEPWARPGMVDTRLPGLGNQGHTFGSDLTEAQKRDLIAFLSLL